MVRWVGVALMVLWAVVVPLMHGHAAAPAHAHAPTAMAADEVLDDHEQHVAHLAGVDATVATVTHALADGVAAPMSSAVLVAATALLVLMVVFGRPVVNGTPRPLTGTQARGTARGSPVSRFEVVVV